MAKKKHYKRGFTLLELALSTAVLGVGMVGTMGIAVCFLSANMSPPLEVSGADWSPPSRAPNPGYPTLGDSVSVSLSSR